MPLCFELEVQEGVELVLREGAQRSTGLGDRGGPESLEVEERCALYHCSGHEMSQLRITRIWMAAGNSPSQKADTKKFWLWASALGRLGA